MTADPTVAPSTPCAGCGHVQVLHNIRGNGSRGGCSTSWGPTATPCGCKAYVPAEPAPELRRCCQQAALDGITPAAHYPACDARDHEPQDDALFDIPASKPEEGGPQL